jgi:hypothetical protein
MCTTETAPAPLSKQGVPSYVPEFHEDFPVLYDADEDFPTVPLPEPVRVEEQVACNGGVILCA